MKQLISITISSFSNTFRRVLCCVQLFSNFGTFEDHMVVNFVNNDTLKASISSSIYYTINLVTFILFESHVHCFEENRIMVRMKREENVIFMYEYEIVKIQKDCNDYASTQEKSNLC